MIKTLINKAKIPVKLDHPAVLAIPYALALFLLIKLLVGIIVSPAPAIFASDLSVESILKAVDRERVLRNLSSLTTNFKLGTAAQSKADDMQARHYFAHVDPDGNYIWDKIVAAGYSPYTQLGENLAIEFYDTESLVAAWMNSPTHRANILQPGFKDQGAGLTFGDVNINQYHSAIANTFGTLAVTAKKTKPTTPSAAKPSPPAKTLAAALPTPEKASEQTNPAPPATAPEIIQPKEIKEPVIPRPSNASGNAGFALPQKNTSTTTTSETTNTNPAPNATATAVVGKIQQPPSPYQENRNLVLGFGAVLLFMLLSNLRQAILKKFNHLDKKTNDIVLLILSLIVIAFLYWL